MSKQFSTKQEFDKWIKKKFFVNASIEEQLIGRTSEKDIIKALVSEGYTDLNNLVEDDHAYQIGEHKNDGWLYEDEADEEYKREHKDIELRKRR